MLLCKYSNIFGKPNTGVHSIRFFGFALIDTVLTILLAILITYFTQISFIKVISILFIVAQILHVLFCVNTTFVNDVLGIKFDT